MRLLDHSAWTFVYGANLRGRQGKGAALTASRFFGALEGVGEGPCGQSYALPTKDHQLQTLPLSAISDGINRFIDHARLHPETIFQVTRIGAGLAGYTDGQIAPLFTSLDRPRNVVLPRAFERALKPLNEVRVIVTGSRDFSEYELAQWLIESAIDRCAEGRRPVIVSGGECGSDALGERFADEHGIEIRRFPANWRRFGAHAGSLRNFAMAWYSDVCVILDDGLSADTSQMVAVASDEGLACFPVSIEQL